MRVLRENEPCFLKRLVCVGYVVDRLAGEHPVHHVGGDAETLYAARYVVPRVYRQPHGFAGYYRAVKTQVQVVVHVAVHKRAFLAAEKAEDSVLPDDETLALAVFRLVGLKRDEVGFGRGEGDRDAVCEVGVAGRHTVSFRTLFHGTVALICER